jgi:hypothetical protein
MPVHRAHGHPYPQYGPPQQQFQPPPKKSKLKWIPGAVGVASVLFVLLLFAGCFAVANGINEGGNHQEKARTMMAMADNLPEEDWQLLGRFDPKVEQGCLSIDIECVRLSATWRVPHEVTMKDAASRLGLDCSDSARTYKGCPRKNSTDGITADLRIYPAEDAPGTWQVTIDLRAK